MVTTVQRMGLRLIVIAFALAAMLSMTGTAMAEIELVTPRGHVVVVPEAAEAAGASGIVEEPPEPPAPCEPPFC